MVFSSLLFIFLFLPLNLLAYSFAGSIKAKNIIMLVFSLIFYACGEPVYVLLLIFMTLADYLFALGIEKQAERSVKAKLLVAGMLFVNLGLLAVFKYGSFILSNLKILTGFPKVVPNILLPIGISFYTFQLISYVVDVYRKEVEAQKDFFKLLLYVSLFHQCIAGPIVRYKDVSRQIESRRVSKLETAEGIRRFTYGLAKKSVLANACSAACEALITSDVSGKAAAAVGKESSVLALWLGIFAYGLQIYLDFSAYSDMAIGMGKMIGFHYRENFNYPYVSKSVSEFWRRWHISLGSFFRDYVYIPLGGSKKGTLRTVINLFVVWFLTGLWHGASWNYVLWGLYFFVFIMLEKLFLQKLLIKNSIVAHIYLLLAVFFGWILFRFRNLSAVLNVLKGMFGAFGNKLYDFESLTIAGQYAFIILFSVLVCTPLFKKTNTVLFEKAIGNGALKTAYFILRLLLPLGLLFISVAALAGDSYNPFIYFQF